jgi:hypothetical protein
MSMVSLHPFSVHNNVYMPGEIKPEALDAGDVGFPKVTTAGLDAAPVHVPLPCAARIVELY